jgi:hypothetical protein
MGSRNNNLLPQIMQARSRFVKYPSTMRPAVGMTKVRVVACVRIRC